MLYFEHYALNLWNIVAGANLILWRMNFYFILGCAKHCLPWEVASSACFWINGLNVYKKAELRKSRGNKLSLNLVNGCHDNSSGTSIWNFKVCRWKSLFTECGPSVCVFNSSVWCENGSVFGPGTSENYYNFILFFYHVSFLLVLDGLPSWCDHYIYRVFYWYKSTIMFLLT